MYAQRLLHLGHRGEAGELLDVGIVGRPRAQRLQRAPVVALPVAHEAHVVPHSVRLGLRPEDGGERLLRAVVVLQREVGHAELVEEGEVVGGPPARPFQRDHRLRRFALGEGLAEEGKGLVVAAALVRENGLGDEDVGFTLLGARRGGEREQQCRPDATTRVKRPAGRGQRLGALAPFLPDGGRGVQVQRRGSVRR